MRKILFPAMTGLMHGGDYNPEQWLDRPDILEEDIRLMKKAGMNSATLGVFSWSTYEPREGEYHFEWLRRIMDRLYENGIYTILATPSGARPAWLDEKYPEAMRVDSYGVREHHGVRHNHCMTSPIYRSKAANIITRLHEHVGSHPGLVLWHISNEFGGECYCPLCARKFQEYLAEKFDHDIDKLNKAWWTTFWSHTYNDFSQIEPPYKNGEFSVMGLNLEWKRFTTWNMTDYMKSEISLLKNLTPKIPVTTNFMETYGGLDYHVMAKELDVVSWDSYPYLHNDYESLTDTMQRNAFCHALVRSMKKDRPFMLMESAPGLVNWQPYNKMKRPGIHELFSLHTVGCGSDTVQYFQWRKGRGSYEQYHGAVVDHLGRSDTRVFKEVEQLGEILTRLEPVAGTTVPSKAAILFDWDNRWAIEGMKGLGQESKRYEEACIQMYQAFLKLGVDVDVISPEADLEGYKILAAPMLYMLKPGVAKRLKEFVKDGGELLATYLTGYVDENQLCYLGGFPGEGLSELFGVVSEEIDTLYPGDRNAVLFSDGSSCEVRDYAEVLRTDIAEEQAFQNAEKAPEALEKAEILGRFEGDYYEGMPALTRKKYGRGHAWYMGARIPVEKTAEILQEMCVRADVETRRLPQGVELHRRTDGEKTYEFWFNYKETAAEIDGISGVELITGAKINGSLELKKYGTAVIEVQ